MLKHVLLLVFLGGDCRDCFLTRDEFSQLLFAACTPWKPGEAGLPVLGLLLGLPHTCSVTQSLLGPPCTAATSRHKLTCVAAAFVISSWAAGRAPAIHLTLPPPAMLRPRQLWTGKQLISAVVEHFADGRPPLTFSSGSKVGCRVVLACRQSHLSTAGLHDLDWGWLCAAVSQDPSGQLVSGVWWLMALWLILFSRLL